MAPILDPTEDPRGIRNCNPGNLEVGGPPYIGEVNPPDDIYLRFMDPPHGLRAIIECLRAYQLHDGCDTWAKMISRYAPPPGNPTAQYIANTAVRIGIPVDGSTLPDLWDQPTIDAIMKAITIQENGIDPYSQTTYDKAIALL